MLFGPRKDGQRVCLRLAFGPTNRRAIRQVLTHHEPTGLLFDFFRWKLPGSANHAVRTALIGLDIIVGRGGTPMQTARLAQATLLHDIGKLLIPSTILEKRGRLTPSERALMRRHVEFGLLFLADPEFDAVRPIVAAHHEFVTDGYPRSRGRDRRATKRGPGRRQPRDSGLDELAQILTVADITDALLSDRPYKRQWAEAEAEATLRRDFQGDPQLVDSITSRLSEFHSSPH